MHRTLLLLLFSVVSICAGTVVCAHFNLNQNVRIFHVVHTDDGLEIYMRSPMPFLVADKVGTAGPDGLPEPAPYTVNRLEDGAVMHLVDAAALHADPLGLGRLAAEALRVRTGDKILTAEVLAVRAAPLGSEPGFATRDEASAAFVSGPAFPRAAPETYVGDAVVDVHLLVETESPIGKYLLSMASDPGLPGQEATANLILDYSDTATRTYRASGLLTVPVELSSSAARAASTFVVEGIRHVLKGLDHVLFVLCMVIGATSLRSLIGRVTGFTIGHTVTLIAGFFGIAPQGAWFIPTVETAIAISIIFVAADAILRRPSPDRRGDSYGLAISGALGLLHGFGFSFMLHNILRVDAPNVWQSLLAFNVGVEIGQLLIVAVVWPLVLFLRALPMPVWRIARGSMASVAIAISTVWILERAGGILA